MSSIWRRLRARPCPHEHTLVVTSVGVRRAVCEECGHISFAMEPVSPPTQRDIEKTKLGRAVGF